MLFEQGIAAGVDKSRPNPARSAEERGADHGRLREIRSSIAKNECAEPMTKNANT
jgi:hypothetical protein